jgi:hypothetical protein
MSEIGGVNDSGYNMVRIYNVYYTGGFSVDGIYAVANAAGLPIFNSSDSFRYAKDIKIQPHEDDKIGVGVSTVTGVALYTVTYAQKSLTYDPNPLSRPPEIEWGGTDISEVPMKDINGKALVNSAGELYDGLPERPIKGAATCIITRNESSNPATVVTTYSNTTNDAAWNGVAKGNGKLGKIRGVKMHEIVNGTDVVYWRVSYPIDFNTNGWALKPIDNGWVTLDGAGKPQQHMDDNGNTATKQVFLNGSGGLLSHSAVVAGSFVTFPTAGYEIITESTWSTLSLPNPFA